MRRKGKPDFSKGNPQSESLPKGGDTKGKKSFKGKGKANAVEDVSATFFVTEATANDHSLISRAYVPVRYRKENMINLADSPTPVILDLGCTRSMGSRKAVNAFLKAWKERGNQAELLKSDASFKFASSHGTDCS